MTHPPTPSQSQPAKGSSHDVVVANFIRDFFGLQLELLHQKIYDPHALPPEVHESLSDVRPIARLNTADVTPQRLHQLFTHWTMFAQPMVQFEHLPARPGQPSWDRLLTLAMQASLEHSGQTLLDQCNFATQVVTPLMSWLCNGWQAYERNQAKLPWHGCFRSQVSDAGVASLHFYNAVCPASPFENLPDRAAELQKIICELRTLKNVHTVRMASWLNGLPVVQSLFPQSYTASLEPKGTYPNGLGWWGQLITRQGTIHPQKAQQIREKVGFTHTRLEGSCPLEAWS